MNDQPIEARLHLCESCAKVYPECDATREGMVFGCGVGNDNVIGCTAYENRYLPGARVMTADEVFAEELHDKYLWVETIDELEVYHMQKYCHSNNFFGDNECIVFDTPHDGAELLLRGYGKLWRCWTRMPSDEERKAVKWE